MRFKEAMIRFIAHSIGEYHFVDVFEFTKPKVTDCGLASMCILTSLVYLLDVVFSVINLKNA